MYGKDRSLHQKTQDMTVYIRETCAWISLCAYLPKIITIGDSTVPLEIVRLKRMLSLDL